MNNYKISHYDTTMFMLLSLFLPGCILLIMLVEEQERAWRGSLSWDPVQVVQMQTKAVIVPCTPI